MEFTKKQERSLQCIERLCGQLAGQVDKKTLLNDLVFLRANIKFSIQIEQDIEKFIRSNMFRSVDITKLVADILSSDGVKTMVRME